MSRAKIVKASQESIELAAKYLREGKLVAFPSETVYGLGASANDINAINLLYKAKGRPQTHPLILHIADINDVYKYVIEFSPIAQKLAKSFWPGPMTLILPKSDNVLNDITGNQDSVAIRIPNNPIALELIRQTGNGIVAPSANRFGRISATSAEAVYKELGDNIDLILDNGPSKIGIESTIINLYHKPYSIARPGMLLLSQILSVLSDVEKKEFSDIKNNTSIKVSGNLESHYQPFTPVLIMTEKEIRDFTQSKPDMKFGLISFSRIESNNIVHSIIATKDSNDYAMNLYNRLRTIDESGLNFILIQSLPDGENWLAIKDRLNKASYKSI